MNFKSIVYLDAEIYKCGMNDDAIKDCWGIKKIYHIKKISTTMKIKLYKSILNLVVLFASKT